MLSLGVLNCVKTQVMSCVYDCFISEQIDWAVFSLALQKIQKCLSFETPATTVISLLGALDTHNSPKPSPASNCRSE